jgi:hypothetical protein
MNIFHYFDNDEADLFRLDFAMLTLIPKGDDATSRKKYRPIVSTNCRPFFVQKFILTDSASGRKEKVYIRERGVCTQNHP